MLRSPSNEAPRASAFFSPIPPCPQQPSPAVQTLKVCRPSSRPPLSRPLTSACLAHAEITPTPRTKERLPPRLGASNTAAPPSASLHRALLQHRRRAASLHQAPTYATTTSLRLMASCRRRPRPRAPGSCPRLRPLLLLPLLFLSFLPLLPLLLLLSPPLLSLLFSLFLPPPLPLLPLRSPLPLRRHRRRARQPHRRQPPTHQGRQVHHLSRPRVSAACSGSWTRKWTGGCPSRPKRTRPRTSRRHLPAPRRVRAESPSGTRHGTRSRWTPHS